eukprot:9092427-Alexandrium_andersonii.AAC.1
MAAIQAIFEGVEAKVRAAGHNPQAAPFPDSLSEPAVWGLLAQRALAWRAAMCPCATGEAAGRPARLAKRAPVA